MTDDPYDRAMLMSPRVNVAIIRPLVDHLYDPDDPSVVYCLLVNRAQFLREQSYQAHHQTVNTTRGNVCEIVAARIVRRFDEDHTGREGLLKLANVLVAGFEPFQNAPKSVVMEKRDAGWGFAERWLQSDRKRMLTALEVAIVSESKLFLATTACQKIVETVWRGRITYTPTAWLDLVPDRYKRRGISLYDPRRAPLLNQYRLIVPRTRNIIETVQFIILFVLYILAMTNKEASIGPEHLRFSVPELLFAIYGVGWCLDELTSVLEHGWSVHTENLWAFLDLTFVVIYAAYFGLRMHGLSTNSGAQGKQALDVLSLAAPVLLPRLAFCLMNESMLFIALRAMMADFLFLTVLTVWCFGGFLLAMRWLSESQDGDSSYKPVDIAKWFVSFIVTGSHDANIIQDGIPLVRLRRNRHTDLTSIPPLSRANTDGHLRFSRKRPLPHDPGGHTIRHLLEARRLGDCRDPIPPRSSHLRRRQIRRAVLLSTALQRRFPLRPPAIETGHDGPVVP